LASGSIQISGGADIRQTSRLRVIHVIVLVPDQDVLIIEYAVVEIQQVSLGSANVLSPQSYQTKVIGTNWRQILIIGHLELYPHQNAVRLQRRVRGVLAPLLISASRQTAPIGRATAPAVGIIQVVRESTPSLEYPSR